jgi:hypothetical protein
MAVATGLKAMHYDAVGVGSIDHRLGDSYFKVLKKVGIQVVDADTEKHDGAVPYMIKTVDGIKIGIVSFGFVGPGRISDTDLMKARYDAFAEARKKSDILILLDAGSVATSEWLKEQAATLGSPDIVLGTGYRNTAAEPEMVGQTMVLPTTTQGTHINRVDFYVNGKEKTAKFTRTYIDSKTKDDPEILKLTKDYESEMQQKAFAALSAPSEGTYYSYKGCKSCHPTQYRQWTVSPHAKALQTLADQKKLIPECLQCHSEMFKQLRKVSKDYETDGVECQSCHANVVPHGADFKKIGDTTAIRTACVTCHTKEQSPKFDPVTWYKKVKH